jgi:mono/diheme cytochrome c family protein
MLLMFGAGQALAVCLGLIGCGGAGNDRNRPPPAVPTPSPAGEGSASQAPPVDKTNSYAYYGKGVYGESPYSPEQQEGRNTWIMWTAGNQKFFRLGTKLGGEKAGVSIEYFRLLDSRDRATRFARLGLINEPNCYQASKPDEYGLWLDEWAGDPDPKAYPDTNVYGKPTGVIGLRKYPNPSFDRSKWDVNKYFASPDQVEPPYLIGMSCAFCHMGFHPQRFPDDPVNPKWENLAANLGNQYLHEGRIFFGNGKVVYGDENNGQGLGDDDLLHQLGETQQRGTSETSRLSYDFINNPNVINSIFFLENRPKFDETFNAPALAQIKTVLKDLPVIHHVLKDGSDSQSIPIASIRVYVNIGMFGDYWVTRLWNPLDPKKTQQPFEMDHAASDSDDWRQTLQRMPNLEAYLATYQPMYLEKVPGAVEKGFVVPDSYRGSSKPEEQAKWKIVEQGQKVFAEQCAACHSSKVPTDPDVKTHLAKLKAYYTAGKTLDNEGKAHLEKVRAYYRGEVVKPDFLANNTLTDDVRYPIHELKTNAGRSLATNAIKDHVWDQFSSPEYKALPASGEVSLKNPGDPNQPRSWQPPSGGRGYYRTASLVSMWATAPYLHNNSVGDFPEALGLPAKEWPTLDGRMRAFQDAVGKLLNPNRRPGWVKVTTTGTYFYVRYENLEAVLPGLKEIADLEARTDALFKKIDVFHLRDRLPEKLPMAKASDAAFGFFVPKETPINLLANIHIDNVLRAAPEFLKYTVANTLGDRKLQSEAAGILLDLSECPDLVEDHGHEYGAELSDDDKNALIAYLKKL